MSLRSLRPALTTVTLSDTASYRSPPSDGGKTTARQPSGRRILGSGVRPRELGHSHQLQDRETPTTGYLYKRLTIGNAYRKSRGGQHMMEYGWGGKYVYKQTSW